MTGGFTSATYCVGVCISDLFVTRAEVLLQNMQRGPSACSILYLRCKPSVLTFWFLSTFLFYFGITYCCFRFFSLYHFFERFVFFYERNFRDVNPSLINASETTVAF